MGLRSAGSDGTLSGDVYEIGPFPVTDFAQDIAWIDGYFVRWPQNRHALVRRFGERHAFPAGPTPAPLP